MNTMIIIIIILLLLLGGQQRRVSLASALVHHPPLLILDEPTVGVDPVLRKAIWEHLDALCREDGLTVIITTHYIEEARTAETVGLMRFGRLLVQSNPEELLTHHGLPTLEAVFLKLCQLDSAQVPETVKADSHRYESNNNINNNIDVIEFKKEPLPTVDVTVTNPNGDHILLNAGNVVAIKTEKEIDKKSDDNDDGELKNENTGDNNNNKMVLVNVENNKNGFPRKPLETSKTNSNIIIKGITR